jgi:hypothetical protein
MWRGWRLFVESDGSHDAARARSGVRTTAIDN